jgi:hypothetical protein
MQAKGYGIKLAESGRSDGGCIMRGNDALSATCDVLVADSLTGNVLMKVFSSFTTGGNYESLGWGYGPGIGQDFNKLVLILSRASGAPVVANSIMFASELVKGEYKQVAAAEFAAAKKAGMAELVNAQKEKAGAATAVKTEKAVEAPPKELVTAEIPGIEITDLDDAKELLWKEKIYAETGMGCTGPIVLISAANKDKAFKLLKDKGYVGS